MDLWALNLKSGGGASLFGATGKHENGGLVALRRTAAAWGVLVGVEVPAVGIDVLVPARRRRPSYLSVVVRAGGKKKNNRGNSSSGKNDPSKDGHDGTTPQYDKSKSNDSTKKSPYIGSDWRDVRAYLVSQEQELLLNSDDALSKVTLSYEPSEKLDPKWAHPITRLETGCMLVATEKLDGVPVFERTVVLLLSLGSREPEEGPFGVILNCPLHRKIKHMEPPNPDLATFADCSVYCGGPLDGNMFLLRTGDGLPLRGFEEVVSGIRFGSRDDLDEAAALLRKGVLSPQDFRFFVGYASWHFNQLQFEIKSGYWVVAACSSDLIHGTTTVDSSLNLWEEVLQLMGGKYSELSRKPKQDSS